LSKRHISACHARVAGKTGGPDRKQNLMLQQKILNPAFIFPFEKWEKKPHFQANASA